MRWVGRVARMGERGAYRVLVGKLKESDNLEDLGNRCEDNIKMDLHEVGWVGGAWTGLIWLRIGTCGGIYNCYYYYLLQAGDRNKRQQNYFSLLFN